MSKGNGHSAILTFTHAPRRVVSLVPSMTESLFDLGHGDHLVGVTEYCRPPASAALRLARVGGTKDPDTARVASLQPDLVLANQEENGRPAVEAMEAAGLKVWVTFPRSVAESLQVLWALVELFRMEPESVMKVRTLETSWDWTLRAAAGRAPTRVFCPIWQEESPGAGIWWMTFNRHTYAHDVLACCGGENVFADRERRYPLEADLGRAEPEELVGRDTRYPRVLPVEASSRSPEVILLPSEPYAFNKAGADQLRALLGDTPAVRNNRVIPIDGTLLTWHGTRLARALAEIPSQLVLS